MIVARVLQSAEHSDYKTVTIRYECDNHENVYLHKHMSNL